MKKIAILDLDGCAYVPAEIFYPLQSSDTTAFKKSFNLGLLSPTLMEKLTNEAYDEVYICTHRDLGNVFLNTLNPISETLVPWLTYLENNRLLTAEEVLQSYFSSFTTNIVKNLEFTLSKQGIPLVGVSMPRDLSRGEIGFGFNTIIKAYEQQIFNQTDLLVISKSKKLIEVAKKYGAELEAYYNKDLGGLEEINLVEHKNAQLDLIAKDILERNPNDVCALHFFDDKKDILKSAEEHFTQHALDERLSLTTFHHDPFGALVDKNPNCIVHEVATVSHKPKLESESDLKIDEGIDLSNNLKFSPGIILSKNLPLNRKRTNLDLDNESDRLETKKLKIEDEGSQEAVQQSFNKSAINP